MKPLFFITILFASCSTSQSLETRVKAYMKDSVVIGFNDPKSYEWVGMTVDTFMRKKFATELVEKATKDLEKHQLQLKEQENTTSSDIKNGFSNELIEADKSIEKTMRQLVSLDSETIATNSKYMSMPDSLFSQEINIKFRGKNKMGALVLDNIKLRLEGNKFTVVE